MSEPGEEERPDIQKKVFGRWINAKLRRRDIFVTDLYFDLQDGEILLDLISSLADRDLKQEQVSNPKIFFHALLTTKFDIDVLFAFIGESPRAKVTECRQCFECLARRPRQIVRN